MQCKGCISYVSCKICSAKAAKILNGTIIEKDGKFAKPAMYTKAAKYTEAAKARKAIKTAKASGTSVTS